MTRTLTLLDITNNPTSAPPITVAFAPAVPNQTITRATTNFGTFVASGGTGGYTYSATGLAGTGLTLNSATGALTGPASAVGTIAFTVTATDSSTNTTGAQTYSINVQSRLTGVSVQPPAAENNKAGSYQFAVNGATGAVTWSATTLPSGGVTLSAGGLLSWTTSISMTGGTQHNWCKITATDAGTGDTLTIAFIFTLRQSPLISPLSGSTTIPPTITAGVPAQLTFNVAGGIAPFTLSTGPTVPSWATITMVRNGKTLSVFDDYVSPADDALIYVTGTPPAASYPLATQTTPVQFTITDANGLSYGGTWNITILNPNANQPQQSGSNIGSSQAGLTWNYVGAAVTNASGTATVTITASSIGAQPSDVDLTAIAGIGTTGVCQRTGSGTWIASNTIGAELRANNFESALVDKGVVTSAVTLAFTGGMVQRFQTTSATNCTISFTAPSAPCSLWIKIVAPASGTTPTLTWPTVKGGTMPATVTLAKTRMANLFYDGTDYVLMALSSEY